MADPIPKDVKKYIPDLTQFLQIVVAIIIIILIILFLMFLYRYYLTTKWMKVYDLEDMETLGDYEGSIFSVYDDIILLQDQIKAKETEET